VPSWATWRARSHRALVADGLCAGGSAGRWCGLVEPESEGSSWPPATPQTARQLSQAAVALRAPQTAHAALYLTAMASAAAGPLPQPIVGVVHTTHTSRGGHGG